MKATLAGETGSRRFASATQRFVEANLIVSVDCEPHINATRLGVRDAAMRVPGDRETQTQGNRTMTKNFALAASIAMLMTISGQALAATAAPNAWYGSEATSPSAWQTVYAGNAFNGTAATETAHADAFHYHGGPKSND
jgi:hypothetical protein